MLNDVNVKIRLERNKNAFALVAGGNDPGYKINIVEAAVFARKATLNLTVQLGHAAALEKGKMKYPLRCVVCKVSSIPQGVMTCLIRTTTCTSAPGRNELCCVASTTTLTTAPTTKPRSTQSNDINFLMLYVGGRPNPAFQDEGNDLTRGDFAAALKVSKADCASSA